MKNNLQPLVSIGIASYNNSKYIIETLNSVANQTYKNIELMLILPTQTILFQHPFERGDTQLYAEKN